MEVVHSSCGLSMLPSAATSLFDISAAKSGQCLTDMMPVPPEASTSFDSAPF